MKCILNGALFFLKQFMRSLYLLKYNTNSLIILIIVSIILTDIIV